MFQTNEMIIIGFVGQSGVGKTHLIHRYLINSIPEKLNSTIAVQFATGFYKMQDGTKLKLKIWDTSGQQKYKQIVCYHLKQVQAVVIVYDISCQKSFNKIDEWLQRIQKQQIQKVLLVLIGNKNDLKQNRKITYKKGQQKAKQIGAQFYQINSYEQGIVRDVFGQIVQTLIQRKAQQQINKKNKQQQRIGIQKQQQLIKNKQELLPLGIQQSGAADALCSNCQLY